MAVSINDIVADPVKRENLESRFWPKVRRDSQNACWPWTAKARHRFGYGAISCGRGNVYLAHVVSYALCKGNVPQGAFVLHSCDNPSCCNPAHLALGDHAANMKDMKIRGRRLGYSHSDETRRKISEARAKNPPKMGQEARQRLSDLMKERWEDPDQVRKMVQFGDANGNFGKRLPDHVLAAAKANHRSKRGYRHSEETKQKMRDAALRRNTKG